MKLISQELRRKKSEAGRKGGQTTLFKHGRDRMRKMGKLGGRPRLLTLEELMSQSSPGGQEIKEERPSDVSLQS